DEFDIDWGGRYPVIIRMWRQAWDQFTPFLAFPPEIRRIVYTTNAIESLNARFRQATRRRGPRPGNALRQEAGQRSPPGSPAWYPTVDSFLIIGIAFVCFRPLVLVAAVQVRSTRRAAACREAGCDDRVGGEGAPILR